MTHLFYETHFHATDDQAVIDRLTSRGWQVTVPPSFDPATQAAPVWHAGQWFVRDLTPDELAALTRKVWPHADAFLRSFELSELAGISLSTDPTIAALRLLLTAWPGEVWSDDPQIVQGLDALEAQGILAPERRAALISTS